MKIVTWDWKAQPRIEDFNEALAEIPNGRLIEVDSGGDDNAVVVAPAGATTAMAQKFYEEHKFQAEYHIGV